MEGAFLEKVIKHLVLWRRRALLAQSSTNKVLENKYSVVVIF
jgi:hypothetical protein